MNTELLILLIPLLPLLAAMVIGALGPRLLRGQSHWPAITAAAGSFSVAASMLFRGPTSTTLNLFTWFTAGSFEARVSFHYDPLAAIMLFTVTLVSLLVLVYSREYMKGDPGYPRFFACMSLFIFSMCTLVLADNFVVLFLGWEGVGLCSYLLIGFFYRRPAAAAAAKKAFIVTRLGDCGLLLGVLLTFVHFGSLDFTTVFKSVESIAFGANSIDARLTWIALLLLCGAIGKSGQLLLHIWLPDAMEGPSPVSALIHAATMVTAGVYLVARTQGIFLYGGVLPVVAVLGCATAFFAATIACVQVDIKRILAYSTISQLGYMFLGLGAGVSGSAIFHLFTHAFFKSLLFLAAGAVMHAMAGVIDLRKMGGLFRRLPLTGIVFLAGCLALAGIPGAAGFFSKEEIITGAFRNAWLWSPDHEQMVAGVQPDRLMPALGWVAILTAGITAFYTLRLFMRVFVGPEKLPEETGGHVHRPGVWMAIPMVLLAIGAITAGWFGANLHDLLYHMPDATGGEWISPEVDGDNILGLIGSAVAIGGAILALLFYGPLRNWTTNSRIDRTWFYKLLWNKFYIDEFYDRGIVRPLRAVGRLCVGFDEVGINNGLRGVTWAPRGLGWLLRIGQRGRAAGSLGGYAMVFAAGAAVLVGWLLWMVR